MADAGERPGASSWRGKLALLAVSTALSLLLAEALVRVVAPQQLILLRPDVWRPHDGLGWVQSPNLDTRINTGEREIRLLTDADGYRVGPGPRPKPAYRVLALGDSYQAALQVEYEQTFTGLLEQRLSADLGAPVEVVNASVAGWGPSHYLLKAKSELARRRYDQVVIFFYLGNDVEKRRREHFRPKKSTVRHSFRWPDKAETREVVESFLYPVNDALETRSHAFVLFKKRLWFLLMRFKLSARRFPETLLREQASAERWSLTAGVCRQIAAVTETHGVSATFVLMPGICEVDLEVARLTARGVGLDFRQIDPDQPSRRMTRELESRGLTVLDATPAMRAAHAAGRRDLYGRIDVHLGVAGHQVVAEVVAPPLAAALRRTPRPQIEQQDTGGLPR